MVYPVCVGCGGQIRQDRKFKIGEGLQKIFWSARLLRRVDSNDCICQPCRFKFVAWKKETDVDFVQLINQEVEKTEDVVDRNNDNDDDKMKVDNQVYKSLERIDQGAQTAPELERVEILVDRTTKSEKACIVCGLPKAISRRRLTNEQRHLVFLKQGVFVPPNSRCCKKHLYKGQLKYEALKEIKSTKRSFEMWGAKEVTQCLDEFRVAANVSRSFDFDDPSNMSDADYLAITGLSKDNFNHLLQYLTTMRNSRARSLRVALAIYLTKPRLGVSNSVLATIFRLRSKRAISHILQQVRQGLANNFTSIYLGFNHISREEVLAHHQTAIADTLLTSQPNQRRTYSMHKHRNLLKPMIITATDGYILSVLGPFLADYNNNDASIIKHCLFNNEQDMLSWFKDDDVMIVDRGVRFVELGERKLEFNVN